MSKNKPKRKQTKLELKKETIRRLSLTEAQLAGVAGGAVQNGPTNTGGASSPTDQIADGC